MMKSASVAAIVIASLLSGCASITTGHGQPLSVDTRDQQGKQVTGAACRLVNDKGTYFIQTPGTVSVQRSYGDMHVNCTKEQIESGVATVKSSTKAMAFGNIIFGGIIGAAIDAGSGAAYDYPSLLTVIMGKAVTIEEKPPANDATGQSQPAQAGTAPDMPTNASTSSQSAPATVAAK
ncbi:MAG: hypothetical protein H6R01_532 [Burkholderiaceae bacterium]|nr:hypothetical protein [Burkholderiaceae bacterium]